MTEGMGDSSSGEAAKEAEHLQATGRVLASLLTAMEVTGACFKNSSYTLPPENPRAGWPGGRAVTQRSTNQGRTARL